MYCMYGMQYQKMVELFCLASEVFWDASEGVN